ncbi:MAG: cyclase family protein [Bacteroidota bacterium]
MKHIAAVLLMIGLIGACATRPDPIASLQSLNWIDLTHSFDSSTLFWPNNPEGFTHPEQFAGKTPLGYYYSSYTYSAPEHGGTHLDAPIHFAEGRLTSDELPLDRLTGAAVVIDVSDTALVNRDYQVSVAALEKWEASHGRIPDNTIILFMTGYSRFYPDRLNYFGTDLRGNEAISQLHFPGISTEAATWMTTQRIVKAVGIDTPSLDHGQSKNFSTHQVLMGADVPGFENVTNLDQLPAAGLFIVALPMKIRGGSGGPLRIIAAVPATGQ